MKSNPMVLPAEQKRKRILKAQVKTNPHYGKRPDERTIPELLDQGCCIIDKPSGPTSHQVVAWVKEILDIEKAGHSGTLDPNVTGMLPVALGSGTKAVQVMLTAGKEYVGIMRLHSDVSKKDLEKTCASFIGSVTQLPPVRSAVKRVKRQRQIYYFQILEKKDREVLFRVGCEAGTYIRTLCVDIGKQLKIGANLSQLRRTKVGQLTEENCVFLQDIKDAFVFWQEEQEEQHLRNVIHPVEKLLTHLPKIIIRDSAVDAICHGAALTIPGVVEVDTGIHQEDHCAIMTLKGEAVAVGTSLLSTEEIIEKDVGRCATLQRVLMKKGTYPSTWKKG